MKILITGSCGFIGFHLIKSLLEKNHTIVGIDNLNDYYDVSLKLHRNNLLKSKNYQFINEDINNIRINDKFDLAINLAAQAGIRVPKEKEHLYEHSNVDGFVNFCDLCKQNKIKRIIYASSSSVYSDKIKDKFSESRTNIEPKSKYGLSKLFNEQHASQEAKKNNSAFIGLRFFSVYGPYGRPDMAYFLFTDAISNDQEIVLNNNGQMARDMTYIDDIVSGINGAIDYIFKADLKGKNEIFNLGNDKPIKTIELLEFIEKNLSKKAIIQHMKTLNESSFTHADLKKSKKYLGYEAKTSFEDGIKNFLDWYKTYKKKS